MELSFVDVEITKVDKQADGTVIVRGPATTDDIDSDKQIIDADFAAKKLPEWLKSGGNVRSMHKPDAIGGGMSLEREGNAQILTAHILDPTACLLATPHPITGVRVLRAFSVGISGAKIVKDFKAPGGRIVDGEFVEVSLVDRPANSSCKVDLVSKMENGNALFSDILVKADTEEMADCDTCKGSGTIKDGNVDCPDCDGKGKITKRAMDDVGGEHVDRDKIDESDFAGPNRSFPITNQKSVEAAWHLATTGHGEDPSAIKERIKEIASRKGLSVPSEDDAEKTLSIDLIKFFLPEITGSPVEKKKGKGKIPKDDADVTDDLNQADAALHNAKDSQAADNAAHMSGDGEEMEKADAPYIVKRLHDHICPVFTPDAVKGAYPAVANFADVVDPGYWAQHVTDVLGAAQTNPALAGEVAKASELYGLAIQLNKADSEIVEAARDELAKAFADSYPSIHLSPGDITAGQFKRPALTSGRANATAKPGQKPRLPMQATVPEASQFDRHYMTDGRAAPSPMQGEPNSASMSKIDKLDCVQEGTIADGVTVYKMVHTPSGLSAQGATAKDAWKALKEVYKDRQFYTNNAKDQMMQTMETMHDMIVAMHPGLCAMKADDPMETKPAPDDAGMNAVDNSAHGAPKDANMAISQKGETPDVQKLIDTAISNLEKRYEDRVKKLKKRLHKAEEEKAQLEKLADPELGVYRTGRGALPFLPKSAEETSQGPGDQAEIDKREKVEWLLQKLHTTTDQSSKRQTLEKLEEILTPDELAAALVTG